MVPEDCAYIADASAVMRDGDHRIIWGDALTALSCEVADKSIDLVFADPPYNIGKNFAGIVDKWPSDADYLDWCYSWLEICIAKLSDTGAMYVMSSTQLMPYLDIFLRDRLDVISRIAWCYDSSGVQARRSYGSLYEPILFCVKDKRSYVFNADDIRVEAKTGAQRKLIDYRKPVPAPYASTKVPGNVWTFSRVRYRMAEYAEHPTQKPEALLDRIVRASSSPGDIVLDPFAGSFTTAAVAQRLGRRSVGIELHRKYVDAGLERLRAVQPQLQLSD